MRDPDNPENLIKAIRLVWDSLDSHLDGAISEVHKKKCCNKAVGNRFFHKQCAKEYAFVLQTLIAKL